MSINASVSPSHTENKKSEGPNPKRILSIILLSNRFKIQTKKVKRIEIKYTPEKEERTNCLRIDEE